jgi:hypothetical protein
VAESTPSTQSGRQRERLAHLRQMLSYPDGPTLNNDAARFLVEEIDRLTAIIKAAAQVCRNADAMNSLGPIQALAIALEKDL